MADRSCRRDRRFGAGVDRWGRPCIRYARYRTHGQHDLHLRPGDASGTRGESDGGQLPRLSPPNLQFLRQFMSSTPDQRVTLLNAVKNNPGADEALPVFTQMMTSCVNY